MRNTLRKIVHAIARLIGKPFPRPTSGSNRQPIFPAGHTADSLYAVLSSFFLEGTDGTEYRKELENYLRHDYLRFVHTLNLIPNGHGKMLEIGANPYFTSILVRLFTQYDLSCTNFFVGKAATGREVMTSSDRGESFAFDYINSNIEDARFTVEDRFDVVLFCEVIEHLIEDPLAALKRLKQTLKPGGYLILSTPNVNRLENVAKMVAGENIYDPYSAYGPYGRHNREYNQRELEKLLRHAGFSIEEIYSADVHVNYASTQYEKILPLLSFRKADLGQYIFIRARNAGDFNELKPSWLYRSYLAAETCA